MTYRIRLRPHVVGAFLFVGLLISLCLVIAFAIPPRNAHAAHFAGQGCSVLLREGVLLRTTGRLGITLNMIVTGPTDYILQFERTFTVPNTY